jgi:hypothetical protein
VEWVKRLAEESAAAIFFLSIAVTSPRCALMMQKRLVPHAPSMTPEPRAT